MTLASYRLPEGSGRGIRIAVVDSGVNPDHPHIGGIKGGVGLSPEGLLTEDYIDRLGHGTAVAAAIHEKAPEAELLAVKVFDRLLAAPVAALTAGLDWAVARQVRLVNLSLGTAKLEHEPALRSALDRAIAAGVLVVSAQDGSGRKLLPGSLAGVVPVLLDWDCPRGELRARVTREGEWALAASGYPREVPGVPPERNLKGLSFAVANATGLLAQVLESEAVRSVSELRDLLEGLLVPAGESGTRPPAPRSSR